MIRTGRPDSKSSKKRPKWLKNSFHQIEQLMKDCDDRLALENLNLVERYRKNKTWIHVHGRFRHGFACQGWIAQPEEYCALFYRKDDRATRGRPNRSRSIAKEQRVIAG